MIRTIHHTSPYQSNTNTLSPEHLRADVCECHGLGLNSAQSSDQTSLSSPFANSIKTTLTPDAQGNIHEEELQHAIVTYLLDSSNPEASAFYQQAVNELVGAGVVGAGLVGAGTTPISAEDAIKQALIYTVDAGFLSQDQAEAINGASFDAAQLDQNLTMLFDGRGSTEDPTIAVMNIDQAIISAQNILLGLEEGTYAVTPRALDASSNAIAK